MAFPTTEKVDRKRPREVQFITVKALAVRPIEGSDGLYSVELPAITLSEQEHEMINAILPDLKERVYELLPKQALLNALVTK